MEEKRNVKRFDEEIDGFISFKDPDDPSSLKSLSIKTVDVSLHGVKTVVSQSLPAGSNLKITLNLKRLKQVVKIEARVAWLKEREGENSYEMGIEFLHDTKTIENMHKYLYGER
jgi:c-di-GMP-binding flagellar brake protein YcgR